MIEVFSKNFVNIVRKVGNVVFLSEKDFCLNSSVEKFFPGRTFNFGLGKRNLAMVAAGFCLRGKMPLILVCPGFVETAFIELKDTMSRPNLNMKIVCIGRSDSQDQDLELLKLMPHMKIYESDQLERMMQEYGPGYLRVEY